MRFLSYICIFVLLSLSSLFGEEQAPQNGKELYDAKKYEEAASWYLNRANEKGQKAINYYNAARSLQQDYIDNHNMESLNKAVSGYYRVLVLDPEMKEAKINLELARMEQEKSQQNRTGNNKDKKNNQSDKQSQDDQNKKDGSSSLSSMADKQKKLSESKPSDNNKSEQESLKQDTENALKQSENQKQKEALQKALDQQKEALDKMNQNQQKEAQDAQKNAAEYLKEASEMPDKSDAQKDALPQNLQKLLNQEQSRKKNEQNPEDLIQVERNW